jgi:hypothetical protein
MVWYLRIEECKENRGCMSSSYNSEAEGGKIIEVDGMEQECLSRDRQMSKSAVTESEGCRSALSEGVKDGSGAQLRE